ncbi:MAG: glycoside hydrolase family 88 protein [Duncaniella sp.]|nr:glycoside hydrolase family 88 protein [Duncaniella sp.]
MKLTSIIPLMGMALSAAVYTGCVNASAETELDIDGDLAYCNAQIHRTLDELRGNSDSIDYTMMPRNMEGDATCWHCRKADKEEWCGGFWPGILWYNYEATGDTTIRKEAEKFTSSLEFLSKIPAFDHDLGFLMFCSYGNGYRLTRDPHYRQVIIDTADSLATLYNPNVGTILSWPRNVKMLGGHNTIMDNMINLEMLFWAAKNGGSSNLYDIAVKHAETTMKHHFRPDFTCYHVAVYDSVSGDFIKGMTHQGYADNSLWARGQSWAIYGYTMVYRETRDPRFLDFAQKVTDVYLDRLPEDYVPYWDFDDPRIPDAPRDASAAAVVASALLELQGYVLPEQSKKYLAAAEKMLASLGSDAYRSGDRRPAFLDHSVGHHPAGSEIDAAIIYADYYYIEALLRKKKLEEKHDVLATL